MCSLRILRGITTQNYRTPARLPSQRGYLTAVMGLRFALTVTDQLPKLNFQDASAADVSEHVYVLIKQVPP
eukprot:COSAG01_NODE_2327_length_7901_cov_9.554858_3_plen_71_part_00